MAQPREKPHFAFSSVKQCQVLFLPQAAAFRLSEGLTGEAQLLGARAAKAAEAAVSSAKGSTGKWAWGGQRSRRHFPQPYRCKRWEPA